MTELVLGTVQLGMAYGATNTGGQPSSQQALNILDAYHESGGRYLDTAPAYGDSESLVGVFNKPCKVCTKSAHVDVNSSIELILAELQRSLDCSLQNLKGKKVELFLLHQASLLNHPDIALIVDWLLSAKRRDEISEVGVSIYHASQVEDWEKHLAWLDWVQLPVNLLDQRAQVSGFIDWLVAHEIKVQARSVFLQGLLLAPNNARIKMNEQARHCLERVALTCVECQLTPLELALGFVRRLPVQQVLVGVNSVAEWTDIDRAWQQPTHTIDCRKLRCEDEYLITPSLWKLKSVS
mgnify:FL=1